MTGGMNTDPLPKTDTVLTLLRTQKDGKEHAETTAELGRIYARCLVRDAVREESSAADNAQCAQEHASDVETVTSFLAGKVAEHGEAPIGYVEAAMANLFRRTKLSLNNSPYATMSPETKVAYEALPTASRRAVNGKLMKLWRVEHLYPEWRAFLKGLT